MISVIIPTMWQFEPFCRFLKNLVQLPVIGEVILINNLIDKTPNDSILIHPKIRMLNQEKNIYVNPAWNLGAREARFNTLCFLSDDVIVDLKLFLETDSFIEQNNEKLGLVFINPSNDLIRLHAGKKYDSDQWKDIPISLENVIVTGDISFTENISSLWGFGSLFFCKKECWVPIPESLLIHYGDTWAFETQRILNRRNYAIVNCLFYTPWSVTCASGLANHSDNGENFTSLIEQWKSKL